MMPPLDHISAMSLFVEDLPAAKVFYQTVFGVKVLFEDDSSVALKFENLIVNSFVQTALEIIGPAPWLRRILVVVPAQHLVEDVDTVCSELRKSGVKILRTQDRPWGRTANSLIRRGTAGKSASVLRRNRDSLGRGPHSGGSRRKKHRGCT
jgi:catechol 2,3-dioxygenase-like lactoylglutathione lyase family enzyme